MADFQNGGFFLEKSNLVGRNLVTGPQYLTQLCGSLFCIINWLLY